MGKPCQLLIGVPEGRRKPWVGGMAVIGRRVAEGMMVDVKDGCGVAVGVLEAVGDGVDVDADVGILVGVIASVIIAAVELHAASRIAKAIMKILFLSVLISYLCSFTYLLRDIDIMSIQVSAL